MTLSKSLAAGAAGATVLTLVHESARHALPDAPRVDLIAMRALAKPFQKLGVRQPSDLVLHRLALAGDLFSNSLYYSLAAIGSPRSLWSRSIVLGLLAGATTVLVPPYLGLGQQPSRRFPLTAALTVAWYLSGAVVAAFVLQSTTEKN